MHTISTPSNLRRQKYNFFRNRLLYFPAGFLEQSLHLAVPLDQPVLHHLFLCLGNIRGLLLAPSRVGKANVCPDVTAFLVVVDGVERDEHAGVLDVVHQTVHRRAEHEHLGRDGQIRRHVRRDVHPPHPGCRPEQFVILDHVVLANDQIHQFGIGIGHDGQVVPRADQFFRISKMLPEEMVDQIPDEMVV